MDLSHSEYLCFCGSVNIPIDLTLWMASHEMNLHVYTVQVLQSSWSQWL